jgi:hypothetical protein
LEKRPAGVLKKAMKPDFKINLIPIIKLIRAIFKPKPKRPVSNEEIFKKL